MNKPEPCKHCGAEANCNNTGIQAADGKPLWWVECLGCGINTAGHETREEAISVWNHHPVEYDCTGCEDIFTSWQEYPCFLCLRNNRRQSELTDNYFPMAEEVCLDEEF